MSEPLTLEELKQRADIVRDDIDAVLTSLIKSGREWIESYTGLTVNADSVTQRFDSFDGPMFLLIAPQTGDAVTVSYIDANGDPAEAVDARVITTTRPTRLLPPTAAMWPDSATYVTATVAGVPETFKAAIAIYVRAIHEDGSLSAAYENALEALCRPYRMQLVG